MPTLARSKHFSIHFFPHRLRLLHLSTEKYEPNPSEVDIKVLNPAPTQYIIL